MMICPRCLKYTLDMHTEVHSGEEVCKDCLRPSNVISLDYYRRKKYAEVRSYLSFLY